jgi:outer membrane protein TolC
MKVSSLLLKGIVLLFASVGVVFAQDQVHSMSIVDAVNFALSHSASVQNAILDENSANAQKKEILGTGLPQLSANGSFQYFYKIPTSVLPNFIGQSIAASVPGMDPGPDFIAVQFGVPYNTSIGLSLSQLIFSGEYIVGVEAAKVYAELMSKNIQRTEIETKEAVVKAYYSVLINRKRLNIVDANILRIEKLLTDTRALYQNGFAEKLDVDRLQVTLNNLKSQKTKTETLVGLSLDLLKFQMGMTVSNQLELTDSLETYSMKVNEDITYSYDSRIEYKMLATQQQLLNLNIKRNKAGYLPTLAGFATLNTQSFGSGNKFDNFDFDKQWYPNGVLGLQLNWNVFDGFQRKYRIQQADIALKKSKVDQKNLENAIDMQVNNSNLVYENALITLESQKENVQLAEQVVKTAEIKYHEGVGSSLEISDANTSLIESQINLLEAMYNMIIARIELQKATGKL